MKRVLIFLLFLKAALSEDECPANSQTLWSNLVGNLDQMFWTPFLQRYSIVRYASEERPLHPSTSQLPKDKVPRSCREMGVIHLLDVVCIQLAAQFGWRRPCALWARPALTASMETLLECPRQTWADNEEVAKSLNRTLQTRQHCMHATRAIQCSLLQFHWVVPWLMAVAVLVFLGIALCGSTVFCVGCCCAKRDDTDF